MIDRRHFLGAAAGLPLLRTRLHAARPLRAISYNVHAFGPIAPTDEGKRLIGRARARLLDRYAIELALYEPDVLCLQEASSAAEVSGLAERLEMHHVYLPGGYVDDNGKVHPMFNGAILSRHPIREHQDCPSSSAQLDRRKVFSRHLGRALIATGDERWGDLAVFGCHMLPNWKNTTHVREAEIAAVGEAIAADVEADRSILVLGDMNHVPSSPEYAAWAPLGLVDCAATKPIGNTASCPSPSPSQRIDYVFARGPIAQHLTSCRVLAEGRFRPHEGGEEVRGSWALSDHMPVLAQFG